MDSLNVDRTEVLKFANAANSWWDPKGEFKPLHAINPLRLQFIQNQVELNNKKVLDVGCGGGILSESLARQAAAVTGIDMDPTILQVANTHATANGLHITYQQITVEQLAIEQPHTYDVVTCMEMLEHVPNPSSVIQACAKLVKPGGHLFFSTINRNLKAYLFAVVGAEYLLQLLPKGTHDYAKFIRPAELARWARASDLALQKMAGITYNPFTKEYRLTDDVAVNYLVSFKS